MNKNAQIIRQFIADKNRQEVLALTEELGLSFINIIFDKTTERRNGLPKKDL